MLKPRSTTDIANNSQSNALSLASFQQLANEQSFASADAVFEHLQRVREAYERMANLARDTDAQAARYLLRVPFAQHADCIASLIQLYYPLSAKLLADHAGRLDNHLITQNIHLATDPAVTYLGEELEMNWESISRHYPLSSAQLKRYSDKIDWDEAAFNPMIDWTESLIKKYNSKTSQFFNNLSSNAGLNWSANLVKAFEEKWDLTKDGLLNNEGLPWDDDDEYDSFRRIGDDMWYPMDAAHDIMAKREWERRSINRYFEWTHDYLRENADELDWALLSANPALPFTLELLSGFAERWTWDELASNHGLYDKVLRPWLSDNVVHELLLLTV